MISVVIPAFNEEHAIGDTIDELRTVPEPVEPLRRLTAAAGVDLGGEPIYRDVLAAAEEESKACCQNCALGHPAGLSCRIVG